MASPALSRSAVGRARSGRRGFALPLLAATAAVLLGGCGDGMSTSASLDEPVVQAIDKTAPAVQPQAYKAGSVVAYVKRSVALRARPNGRVVARLGSRTSFGSPTVLSIVRRKEGWYGVIAPEMPNGQVGWISTRAALDLYSNDFRVDVSLAHKEVVVRRKKTVVVRFPIAIGAPGTPTPTGVFAVTDKLLPRDEGTPYGCCILALSAHQEHTPQDWGGGDRVAIHATNHPETIGTAVSLGCMRAPTDPIRRAVHLVPIGTLVTIRA